MGDINLAGFMMTADEWDSLEPAVRIALAASLDRPSATPTVSTLALALRSPARPNEPARVRLARATTEELAREDYDAYELLESAA
jgi:hypothetical protein